MDKDIWKGKWLDFRGVLLNTWGKLTSDDLDRVKGNAASILGLIEQKYGMAKDELRAKFEEMQNAFHRKIDEHKDEALGKTVDNAESVKSKLRE